MCSTRRWWLSAKGELTSTGALASAARLRARSSFLALIAVASAFLNDLNMGPTSSSCCTELHAAEYFKYAIFRWRYLSVSASMYFSTACSPMASPSNMWTAGRRVCV